MNHLEALKNRYPESEYNEDLNEIGYYDKDDNWVCLLSDADEDIYEYYDEYVVDGGEPNPEERTTFVLTDGEAVKFELGGLVQAFKKI